MNCEDVARVLSEGLTLPLRAEAHARSCNRCQELIRLIDSPVAMDPVSPATLRQIAQAMATNLYPVRPVPPTHHLLGAFAGIFISIVALSVYRLGAFAIPVMTPLQTAVILSALAISTGFLASSLVNQMVPGSRHRVSPTLLVIGVTISLTMTIALLFQFQQEHTFWRSAWVCIRAATPIAGLASVLFWLVLRRGAVLSPSMTGAATGLFAGLVGTTVLEFHCPILNGWHILASHLGVAMLCVLGGFVTGLTAEFIGGMASSSRQ